MSKWGKQGSIQWRAMARAYAKKRYAEQPAVREYQKRWNREHKEQRAKNAQRCIKFCRGIIRRAKAKPCADCRTRYPPYVMDFDHVRGTKIAHIGSGRFQSAPKKLAAEIAKCDVVCANCHRKREHRKRRFQ